MTTSIPGNLIEFSASASGHLTVNFFKSQIPQRLPGEKGVIGFDWFMCKPKYVKCSYFEFSTHLEFS